MFSVFSSAFFPDVTWCQYKHPPASSRFCSSESRNWAFAQLGVGLSDITPATTLETFFSVIIAFRRATDFLSGLTYGGLIWWLFFMTWEWHGNFPHSLNDWSSISLYPLVRVMFLLFPRTLGHRHRHVKTQWWSPFLEVFDYLHHIDQSDDLADDRIDQDQRRRGRTEAMLKCSRSAHVLQSIAM